jgi:ABC-type branched-subunit amino acid transport system substrate-binding protein
LAYFRKAPEFLHWTHRQPAGFTSGLATTDLFINPGAHTMQRRFTLKALTAAVALSTLVAVPAYAADTIKVGILHSLSGTMAISETVLKDTVLMAIDEINAKGGVLGKKLEPVVVDPASNWPCLPKRPSSC